MGMMKFPRTGCEQLLTQLLGFGGEKHDDACDALAYLILGLVDDGIEEQKVVSVYSRYFGENIMMKASNTMSLITSALLFVIPTLLADSQLAKAQPDPFG